MQFTASLEKTLPHLFRPIIRLCLRHAIKIGTIEAIIKKLLVEEAATYLKQTGEPQSVSRISVMTGLQRPAVASLLETPDEESGAPSLMTKVIGAWQTKKPYLTAASQPRILEFEGKKSEFAKLVASVSTALNPYTVLYELERAKLVERAPRGLKLLAKSFISRHDVEQSLKFLGTDLTDLVASVEENIADTSAPVAHHHLTTEYDAIPVEKEAEVKTLLLEEGEKMHAKLRNLLSSYDKGEPGKKEQSKMMRVAFCSFSRCDRVRK